MTDQQKLEKITEDFTKSILANTFNDVSFYSVLAMRLAALMDAEIDEHLKHEKHRDELMGFWPKEITQ